MTERLLAWIHEETRRRMAAEAAEIERRIIAGENHITVPRAGGGTVRYDVPGWVKRPILRLRIEWVRWRRKRERKRAA